MNRVKTNVMCEECRMQKLCGVTKKNENEKTADFGQKKIELLTPTNTMTRACGHYPLLLPYQTHMYTDNNKTKLRQFELLYILRLCSPQSRRRL